MSKFLAIAIALVLSSGTVSANTLVCHVDSTDTVSMGFTGHKIKDLFLHLFTERLPTGRNNSFGVPLYEDSFKGLKVEPTANGYGQDLGTFYIEDKVTIGDTSWYKAYIPLERGVLMIKLSNRMGGPKGYVDTVGVYDNGRTEYNVEFKCRWPLW